jgi:HD superfamily phosphohydrolase
MYIDKRWPIVTVSLATAGLLVNRIWDRLLITDGVGKVLSWFAVLVILVALTVYLILGVGNDLLVVVFGRKHVESKMRDIFAKWLTDGKANLEYWPQNLLEEKALSKVKRVLGLKQALSDHFEKLEVERTKLEGQLRATVQQTKDRIDENDQLRERLQAVKKQRSDYREECDSRLRVLEQVAAATDQKERTPPWPQDAGARVSPPSRPAQQGIPVLAAGHAWLEPIAASKEPRCIPDPIYGVVSLDEDVAYIFGQPIFQRLSRIRQLSFSYLNFPSATHTRLAHSLGMCRNADRAMDGILSKKLLYSQSGEEEIRLEESDRKLLMRKCKVAALLHDLGHGPFGHALDKYVGFLEPSRPRVSPDKDYTIKYIKDYLAEPLRHIGLDVDGIARILNRESRLGLSGFDVLIADIIDSPIDVDRMDYLVRDGHMTGLITSAGSADALIEMMRPFRSNDAVSLTFDGRALPAIENLMYLRDFMYVNCYELPEKLAAERAFERIVEETVTTGLLTVDELMLMTDEDVLDFLIRLGQSRPSISGLIQSLLRNTLYQQAYACRPTESTNPEIQNWVRCRLMGAVGGGLKQAYVALPRVWERRIAEEAGIGGEDDWQILVSVPSYLAYVQKESGARILVKKDGQFATEDLFDYSQRLGPILEKMRPASAHVRVFASPQLSSKDMTAINQAAGALLGSDDRQKSP